MRKFLLALAVAVVAVFANVQVVSAETEFRLNEDFEDIVAGVPTGWDNSEGTTSASDYKWYSHATGHTGKGLRFNSYNNYTGYDNYLKTPAMNLSMGSWLLKFWWKNPAGGDFEVYISPDGGTTRTLLKKMPLNQTNWTYEEISITAAANASSNVVILFRGISNYGSGDAYIYLDDVIVESAPDCRAPKDIIISNLTTASATISWGFTDGIDIPTFYDYSLKTSAGATVESNPTLSAPTQTYNITGLTANTTYVVEMQGNCNDSNSGLSNLASATFTTLCYPQAAPYTNDFDALASLPSCTFTSNATVETGGRSGNAIGLHSTAADPAYIVFPELTLRSDSVQATFWFKTSSVYEGNTQLQIGIVTDPTDVGSSFEAFYNGTLNTTTWTEIRINTRLTTQPVTNTTMIAVMIPQAYERTTLVDDASIIAIPTCIRPENFTLSHVTSSTVDLAWDATNAANVRVKIMSATDTTYQVATTNPYTVTGLTPNTDYSFRICGICSATDSSEYNPYTLTAKTACLVATTPLFNENFENVAAGSIPDCWTQGWLYKPAGNTKGVPFALTTGTVHSGTYGMSLPAQADGTLGFISTQSLPINQAGQYTLSVWVYRQEAYYYLKEGLKFWVSPDFNDTTNATLLGYVPRHYLAAPAEAGFNEWYNYEYVINTTGNQYILIEGICQNGGTTYFDDVQVKLTPSCMKVKNVTIGAPTASDVNVSWEAGKDETQWIVNYRLMKGSATVKNITDTVSSATINVNGLLPATTYNLVGSVKSYCGGSDVADSVKFNFTIVSACQALTTLPYTCGFESTEISSISHPLPYCWSRYSDAPNDNYYPYVYTTSYSRTGGNCLNFYPIPLTTWADYGNNQVAILPEINTTIHPMNTLRTVFYARLGSASPTGNKIIVGVMSDPTDLSTFVAVDSVTIISAEYVKCDISFANYTGAGTYMALRVPRSTVSYDLFIDDAKIDVIPTCADIMGSGALVSDITPTSAKITITDQSAEDWSYAYGVAGTSFASFTVVDTTGTTVVIDDLDPQTRYEVHVRRKCSATEYGAWTDAVSFMTACAAVNVPFSDDFEDYDVDTLKGCYAVVNASYYFLKVHSSTATATGISQVNHTAGGSKGVCSSSEYSTPYDGDGTYSTLAYVHLEAGKNYEISVYAKAGQGWQSVDDWNLTFQYGTALNTLTDISTHHVATDSWERYSAYFSIAATGDYYLGLTAAAGTNSLYYYVFFDDLAVEEVACIPPTGTIVSALTSSSATVNVTSSSASWLAVVSSTPIDISGTVTGDIMYDTITTPSFTVSGLEVNTEYYYTLRSICSQGGSSAWMKPSSFRTQCSAFEMPYNEGFEGIGSTLCWTAAGGTGSISRTSMSNTGSGAMLATGATAVSPEFNVLTLAPYSVTGWARSTVDSVNFSILVGNDPSDAASFQDLSTIMIPKANTWVEFTCNFNILLDPDYSEWANARYIAFGAGDKTIAYDDIMVDITPNCPKPSAGTITNVGPHSATISWTESGAPLSWVVEAVASTGAKSTFNATSTTTTITGLNAADDYTVYVRSVCNATDTSYRYKVGTFTTLCDYVNAPFKETFEALQQDDHPNCWDISASTSISKTDNPQYIWGVHYVNGNKAMRMSNYDARHGTALINTPEIILDASKSYELRYDYCSQSNNGDLYVLIKRHSDANFTQIAQHPNNGTIDESDPRTFLTNAFSLNSYAGDTIQVEFLANANWGQGAIWVDNVKVRELSNCVEPATVVVNDIGQNSATIVFTDSIPAHTSWQYAYGPAGFDVTTATPVNVTAKSIPLTGLNSSTAYDVYVRSVCSATDYSPWEMSTFNTTSAPATLPYFTDFSDGSLNAGWEMFGAGQNTFTFGSDANARFATGSAAMYISNGGQYTYNNNVSANTAAARLFYFEENSYSFEFDWKCPGGELNYDFARFYLVPANNNPLPSGSGSFSFFVWPAGMIALDDDQPKSMASASQHVSKVIDFTGKAGSYYLVFSWANDGGGGTKDYPLSVSNVSVSELNCQLITDPEIITSRTTLNSVTATCTNPNPGSAMRWAVSMTNSINDTVMSGIAPADTFTVTGLNSSSQYFMFFRAECSEVNASPWVYIPFSTGCGIISDYPFVQTFEASAFPPACWGNITTATGVDYTGSPVPGEWVRNEFSWTHFGNGQAWAHLNGYTGSAALLVTPAFNFESTREYHVSFMMYHYGSDYYTDQVDVYVGPNPNKTGAVKLASLLAYDEELPAYNDATTIHDYDIPASMTGGNFYIIFEGSYNASGMIYIDDITVDRYPLCRNLTVDPTVEATTATTVTASEPMGNKTAIIFGIAPFTTTVTPADITATVTSTTGTATFTGLNANTIYVVYARGICPESQDTTAWTGFAKFTTKADDCFMPDGLHNIGNISDTSIVIAWNPVPDAQEYQCVLTTASSTLTQKFYVTTNQVTIDTLMQNSQYGFKVRAICGAGDTTAYSSSFLFKTLTTPANVPYATGFEATDDNSYWTTITSAKANNYVFGTSASGVLSGMQGLYISNNGTTYAQTVPSTSGYYYDNVYNIAYAIRTVYFSEAGNYDISFDWKCDPAVAGTYYQAFGRAYLAPTDVVFTADDPMYQRRVPEGAEVLGSDLIGSRTWQTSGSIVNIAEPGYRNVVFMWFALNQYNYASASNATDYPLAIDNLSITEAHCIPPTSLTTMGISDTYGSVVVEKADESDINYTILTVSSVDSIQTYSTLVSTGLKDTITFSGLNPSSQYYVFVRTVCDSAHVSNWRKIAFRTTAVPATLPYVCDFENATENAKWQYALDGTNHFIVGSGTSNGGDKSIYVTDDNSSNSYDAAAQTDATYASRIFYLAEGLYEYSFDWKSNGESTLDYGRVFLLPASVDLVEGTVLNGLTTASVPSGAIAIDGGLRLNLTTDFTTVADTFRITTPGSYNLVLYWHNDYSGGSNPPLAVDNILLKASTCLPPTASVITSVTTETSITAVIKNHSVNSSIVYGASLTGKFEDAVAIDTIPYNAGFDTVVLNGLSASSTYQLMVRSICGEGDESLWSRTQFKTLCGVVSTFPYTESFESLGTSYQQGLINDICWKALNDNTNFPKYNGSTSSPADGLKCLQMHSSASTDLYFALPQMTDINGLNLSFSMKSEYTTNSNGVIYAGYMTNVNDASTFVSLLTTARSTTWTSYDVVIANAPAGARIAFKYGDAGMQAYYGWLDNIRVSELVQGPVYYDTICHNKPYNLHGFNKSASQMNDGDNTLTRVRPATEEGEKDTLYVANVYMRPAIASTSYDTICQGEPYIKGLWTISNPKSRRYYQTFAGGAACGCDTTVELWLTVIPTALSYKDTICFGGSYVFGDTVLTTPGKYVRSYTSPRGCTNTDTLYLMVMSDSIFESASVCQANLPYVWRGQNITTPGLHYQSIIGKHGCPQVVALDLNIFQSDSTVFVAFCEGGFAQVADTVITTAGNYTIVRINEHQCDVTYHITATVTAPAPQNVYDNACEGHLYTGYGISSLYVDADTVVVINTKTIDAKCDSVAIIHLTFIETKYTEFTAKIVKGDVYRWNGEDFTEEGDYPRTFQSVEGCDSVVTLHLAYKGAGVENVANFNLNIVPNPVNAGQTSFVHGNFNGVKNVEILNSFGQVIDAFVPDSYPIEVKGIQASGIYFVRITTDDDKVAVEKLVVK